MPGFFARRSTILARSFSFESHEGVIVGHACSVAARTAANTVSSRRPDPLPSTDPTSHCIAFESPEFGGTGAERSFNVTPPRQVEARHHTGVTPAPYLGDSMTSPDDPLEPLMAAMAAGDLAALWSFHETYEAKLRAVVLANVRSMHRPDIVRDWSASIRSPPTPPW